MKPAARTGRRLAAGIALACAAIVLPATALAAAAGPAHPAAAAAAPGLPGRRHRGMGRPARRRRRGHRCLPARVQQHRAARLHAVRLPGRLGPERQRSPGRQGRIAQRRPAPGHAVARRNRPRGPGRRCRGRVLPPPAQRRHAAGLPGRPDPGPAGRPGGAGLRPPADDERPADPLRHRDPLLHDPLAPRRADTRPGPGISGRAHRSAPGSPEAAQQVIKHANLALRGDPARVKHPFRAQPVDQHHQLVRGEVEVKAVGQLAAPPGLGQMTAVFLLDVRLTSCLMYPSDFPAPLPAVSS